MSVRTMARVWECSQQSGSHLLMLLAIADFADDDGRAYPSVPTLARKCRMKPRNANKVLSALKASGELDIVHGKGPRGTSIYRVKVDAQGLHSSTGVHSRTGCPAVPEPLSASASPPCPAVPETPVLQDSQTISEPSLNHQEPPERVQRRSGKAAKRPLPDGFGVSPRVEAWAMQHGHGRLPEHLEAFKLKCQANGYAYADWDAAFMTAIRDDWAGLGQIDTEPAWRREQRERNEAFLGPAAAKRRSRQSFEAVNYDEGVAKDGRIA